MFKHPTLHLVQQHSTYSPALHFPQRRTKLRAREISARLPHLRILCFTGTGISFARSSPSRRTAQKNVVKFVSSRRLDLIQVGAPDHFRDAHHVSRCLIEGNPSRRPRARLVDGDRPLSRANASPSVLSITFWFTCLHSDGESL